MNPNKILLLFLIANKNRDCGFTEAALAGLASKEDFSSIKLKRSDSTAHTTEYPPFQDTMLIQIKGKLYKKYIYIRIDKKYL